MNRWSLLEHKVCKNKLFDIHYDFLIEMEEDCLTWKLLEVPKIDGLPIEIFQQPNHRLFWLTNEYQVLSRNRGIVRRIDFGLYRIANKKLSKDNFSLILDGNLLNGLLNKEANICCLKKIFD